MANAIITAAVLKKFAPQADAGIATTITNGADDLAAAGITTPLRAAHFLAQVAIETGGLSRVEENLNYTTAARVFKIFKGSKKNPRFKSEAECVPFVKNPQALAIKVYGGRLGNKPAPSTDGWDFRGGGMLQTTGRDNYRKVGHENDPETLRTPEGAFRSALHEWKSRGCNALADKDDVTAVRKAINGGDIGLEDTRIFLKSAKKALGI